MQTSQEGLKSLGTHPQLQMSNLPQSQSQRLTRYQADTYTKRMQPTCTTSTRNRRKVGCNPYICTEHWSVGSCMFGT